MITAHFADLDGLPAGELRVLLDLFDRLHAEAATDHPPAAGFLDACRAALVAEKQRRWDELVERSRRMGRLADTAPDRVPWPRRSPVGGV